MKKLLLASSILLGNIFTVFLKNIIKYPDDKSTRVQEVLVLVDVEHTTAKLLQQINGKKKKQPTAFKARIQVHELNLS